MRAGTGWVAAAAIAAAACGGANPVVQTAGTVDEHQGSDAVCDQCKVTGGGQFQVGEQRIEFTVRAIPESGPAAGPGFGGEGIAASGQVDLHPVGMDGSALQRGIVDTILGCTRTDGVLTATFSGSYSGGRFTATVTDRGESGTADAVGVAGSLAFGPITVANGNVQVHELAACHAPCTEGMCWCAPSQQCEPCGEANHHEPVPVTTPVPVTDPILQP